MLVSPLWDLACCIGLRPRRKGFRWRRLRRCLGIRTILWFIRIRFMWMKARVRLLLLMRGEIIPGWDNRQCRSILVVRLIKRVFDKLYIYISAGGS